MTPIEPRSGGDWIILDEFVDDASTRPRSTQPTRPTVDADQITQRVVQLTHDMYAAKVEPEEIVRRVLEIFAPSLQPRTRDEIRSMIENQIRSYQDGETA